jgi:transcriptional antiterminator RfaH
MRASKAAIVMESEETINTRAWYLLHTKPRQETTACLNLERQGYQCYLPSMQIEKLKRGKVEVVTEPLFARYLFVYLDTSNNGKSWSPIRSTLGVCSLVQFGGKAAKVDDALVELLRHQACRQPAETLFKQGDRVLLTSGPFKGLEAVYQTTSADHRALILLDILSRPVSLKIDVVCLRKVA